jgi:hypothetical protein
MVCWAVSLKYKLQSGGEFLYVHPSLMVADSSHPLPLTPHPLPTPPPPHPSPFSSLVVVSSFLSSLPSLLLRYCCEFTLSLPSQVPSFTQSLFLPLVVNTEYRYYLSLFAHRCEYSLSSHLVPIFTPSLHSPSSSLYIPSSYNHGCVFSLPSFPYSCYTPSSFSPVNCKFPLSSCARGVNNPSPSSLMTVKTYLSSCSFTVGITLMIAMMLFPCLNCGDTLRRQNKRVSSLSG